MRGNQKTSEWMANGTGSIPACAGEPSIIPRTHPLRKRETAVYQCDLIGVSSVGGVVWPGWGAGKAGGEIGVRDVVLCAKDPLSGLEGR